MNTNIHFEIIYQYYIHISSYDLPNSNDISTSLCNFNLGPYVKQNLNIDSAGNESRRDTAIYTIY